jgi:hypothetical protein
MSIDYNDTKEITFFYVYIQFKLLILQFFNEPINVFI